MSFEKVSLTDLLDSSGGSCASTSTQRRWHTNLNARRYHNFVESHVKRNSLSEQLIRDLTETKRSVSEVIQKNRMAELLKLSKRPREARPVDTEARPVDTGRIGSDSGVSLNTFTGSDTQDWLNTSFSNVDINRNINRRSQNGIEVTDIFVLNTRNESEDVDFFTPRSYWEENGGTKAKSSSINQLEESFGLMRQPSGEDKGICYVQTSCKNSPSTDARLEITSEYTNYPETNLDSLLESSTSFNAEIGVSTADGAVNSSQVPNSISNEPFDRKNENLNERTFNYTSSNEVSDIAKSLIKLAGGKDSNINAVTNFVKKLEENSNEISASTSQSTNGDNPVGLSVHTNITDCGSNDSLKWNFPNSNRKREEKLRSVRKEVSEFNISVREETYTDDHQGRVRMKSDACPATASSAADLQTNLISQTSFSKKSKSICSISSSEKFQHEAPRTDDPKSELMNLARTISKHVVTSESVREMNTQAALIYLSETLIESAQRAEMLLMQKMKEYNDLVCRDPPEKRKQDFSCQFKVVEPNNHIVLEGMLNDLKSRFVEEINKRNSKIKKLQSEKRKMKAALKKLNKPDENKPGRRQESELDLEESTFTPRSVSSEPLNSMERNQNQMQFVQALKIENNILHTLIKEMKAELVEENATILSLARKLETSLGQQPLAAARRHQSDVVTQLEHKLEQQERMLKQEAMEARAVAKYVILKYKKLIQEYKLKVKSHQETVVKLTNAIK